MALVSTILEKSAISCEPHLMTGQSLVCGDGLAHMPSTRLPCRIHTTMGTHENYYPEYAFDNSMTTYYWTPRSPKSGDSFEIVFSSPLTLSQGKIQVITGRGDPASDILVEGELDVLAKDPAEDARKPASWIPVGKIKNGQGAGHWASDLEGMRLRITKDQTTWLVIRNFVLE
jgi:hypothetical protein